MSEIIERVARALAKRRYEADNLVGITASAIGRDLYVDKRWPDFEEDARAAIKEMREPSKAMVEVGRGDAKHAWQAMIDAALASPDLV